MNIKNFESGDVEIRKIELSKWGSGSAKPIDLLGQLISLSIYEDLEYPSMILELNLVDGLNLIQNYPIIGEEVIDISFVTPGRDKPTKNKFYIFSVEGTSSNPTSTASSYTLRAVSALHYFGSKQIIGKSYNNTIDEIVKDIVNEVASKNGIGIINISAEKTKGLIPITIPLLSAFEAIDFVRQRAVSAQFQSGGAFIFFENQFGCQFRTLEGLIEEGKSSVGTKIFTYEPATNTTKQTAAYSYRNILNYNNISRFDTMRKVNSGSINNVVQAYNLLTKKTEITEFKLAEKGKSFTTTDNKGKLPNTDAFLQKFSSKSEYFYTTKDSSKGEDYLDALYGAKHSYSNVFNENIVRVLINGDNFMSAGDIIKLNLPDTSGTTEKKTHDTLISGNYLVVRLRHIITSEQGGKPKHMISMDCSKMGYKCQ